MRDGGKKTAEAKENWDWGMKNDEFKENGNIKREQEKKKKVRERGSQQNESEEQKRARDENRKGLSKGRRKEWGV